MEFCYGLEGNVHNGHAAEHASLCLLKLDHFHENRNFINTIPLLLNMAITLVCPVIQIERYKSTFYTRVGEENIADYGCY